MIKTQIVNNAITGYRERRTPQVREIQEATGELIERRQVELCPRSSNPGPGHTHIADTIHIEVESPDVRRIIEGDANHTYGPLLEHGTGKRAAEPHQAPAAQEGRREQNDRYRQLR